MAPNAPQPDQIRDMILSEPLTDVSGYQMSYAQGFSAMYREVLYRVAFSVRSLEDNSLGIRTIRKERKLRKLDQHKHPAPRPTGDNPKELHNHQDDARNDLKDYVARQASHIYSCLFILVFVTTALRLCDILVDPTIRAPCVYAALVLALCYATTTDNGLLPRLFILALLTAIPCTLSGSFSGLFSGWFWVETLYTPVEAYLQDDLSDKGAVRYFLVGTLLSGVFLATSVAMSAYGRVWWIVAAGFRTVVVVCLGLFGLLVLFYAYPRTGREAPILKFLRHTILYGAKLLMFSLNRVAKWLARHPWLSTRTGHSVAGRTRPGAKHIYQLLGPTQIRLLRALHGHAWEPVRCRLEIVDLDAGPFFDAISYVWGRGSPDRFVMVDEARVDAMESAFSVIHRRRSRHRERVLWIDQLCIGQGNDVEKASQVRLMGRIYKSARRVVAWLGPSDSAHRVQSSLAELHYKKQGLGRSGDRLRLATARSGGPHWHALSEFFRNEWFRACGSSRRRLPRGSCTFCTATPAWTGTSSSRGSRRCWSARCSRASRSSRGRRSAWLRYEAGTGSRTQ